MHPHATPTATAGPVYPLPRPAADDPRFTVGLLIDVIEVLTRYGYPPLTDGADLVHLQQALFTAIYQPRKAGQS